MGYIALMEKFGSDETFAMRYLPATILKILDQFNNSYEQLGNSRQTVWKDPLKSGWKNPGFGAWMSMRPSKNTAKNYTVVEMMGLYRLLGNSSLLFGETLSKPTLLSTECQWNQHPNQTKCGWFAQMKAAVEELKKNNATEKYKSLVSLTREALCPNDDQCFNDTSLFQEVFPYTLHVNQYTMRNLIGEQYEVVTNMSQKNLALGYSMKNIINPATNRDIYVPGVVRIHASRTQASKEAKASTVYTCKAGDSKKHQFAGKGRYTQDKCL